MKFLQITLALFFAATLHAEDKIRILSADPADNVLLEISTETPQAVMSSSDLKTWKYVFHYLPPCQNFKAYAAQRDRKRTFFKLAPIHPEFQSLVLGDEIPSLAGKRFFTIGWNFSFTAGGTGTLNDPSFEGDDCENIGYSIVDSRPGMISVRTSIDDGRKLDHLILILDPESPHQFGDDAVVYSADRFGDLESQTWSDFGHIYTFHTIGPEKPPAPVSWPNPVGMVIELNNNSFGPISTVTLGPNGAASIVTGAVTESASYGYSATGQTRATLQLLRSNGSRITAFIRSNGAGQAPYQTAGTRPYSITGYMNPVRLLSYPGPTPP